MGKFEVGQAVILLDGTSLVGRVIEVGNLEFAGELMPTYKVALEGSDGRWYDGAELAPTAADEASQRHGVAGAGDVTDAEKWQRIEADYRSTVARLHGIVQKHKLPAPAGEYVDVTIEREFDRLEAELAQAVAERNAAVAALEPLGRLWVGWERYCDSGDKSYKTITQWIEAMIVPGVVADWLKAAKQAPSATGGAENDDAKSVGVFATGLSALRRSDGSISVYRDLGGGHMIIVDTYDYEKQVKILEKKLASANDLVDQIERNMPQTEEEAHDKIRVGPIAWNAFIAGSIIREYKRREKDVGLCNPLTRAVTEGEDTRMGEKVWSDDEESEVMFDLMNKRIKSDGELLATIATIDEVVNGQFDMALVERFSAAGGDNHSGASWGLVRGIAYHILADTSK